MEGQRTDEETERKDMTEKGKERRRDVQVFKKVILQGEISRMTDCSISVSPYFLSFLRKPSSIQSHASTQSAPSLQPVTASIRLRYNDFYTRVLY